MRGWPVPPPKKPTKSKQEFEIERRSKVEDLIKKGYLKSERIREAMLKVPREDFVPRDYKDYAYLEVPLPLPGVEATISCPHSYPLFYEPLGLGLGHRFLEAGLGSGYGTALAREIVGSEGLVVSMDIDPVTFSFAERNLKDKGYTDIVLIRGDGGLGYPDLAPYDRICITAACVEIPPPLIEQLETSGRLIAPVIEEGVQILTLLEKRGKRLRTRAICEVLYVAFKGVYGSK